MHTLVDTGPLVALISRRDQYHTWAVQETDRHDEPLITCEAVLSEAHFMLEGVFDGRERLSGLVGAGVINVAFSYADHFERVDDLMRTYENVPMSFADACLVRMAKIHADGRVFTTDSDFRIYRKQGDVSIDVLMP